MNPRSLVAALLAVALLSSCGSPLVRAGMSRFAGGGAGSPTVAPAAGAPEVWVTLPSRGVKFAMSQLTRDESVVVWAAKDGSQLALRNGVLISTRGFGRDLMSADAPSIPMLLNASSHSRTFFDLDGTDTSIRHSFSCAMEAGTKAADVPGTRHVIEACTGEIGAIRNEFWIAAGGNVLKSRQWVSQGVGYAAVEPKVE